MPSGVRVLDVGCGTGSVTIIANKGKNNKVCGIEPDEARAGLARARGIDVFCGQLSEKYFLEHGNFDVVVLADVLEHVADPSALLALAAKGLRNNGVALVSVPNVAHWSVRLDLMRGRFDYAEVGIRDATHLRWFTSETIRNLLQHQGFEVLSVKQTAGVDLPEYSGRRPWRWISPRLRGMVVRTSTRAMPSLFGCQHVLKARLKGGPSQAKPSIGSN
jgi:methionine biosynthesis protein MetW